MKRNWLYVIVIVAVTLSVWGGLPAQKARAAGITFYSQGSLAPNLTLSWNTVRPGGGSTPADFTGGDIFVIQNGHNMATTAAWTVSGAGATIQIENGGTLTANNLVAVLTFQIDGGGTYIHNAASLSTNGSSADVPGSTTKAFAATSTIEFQRWTNGGTSPVALPSGVSWGNLTINVATLNGSWNQTGNVKTVNGDLRILQSGGTVREFRLTGAATYTLTIGGNLVIQGGTLNLTSGAGIGTISITGNLDQSNGTLNRTGGGSVNLSIAGNWNRTGGTFTSAGISVVFNGTTEQTIGGISATAFNTLTVASGAKVILPTNATAATLTNNGTITQTQAVAGSGDVTFFNTGNYGGVTINANANGDLGDTIVAIKDAPGATCVIDGQSTVGRCFQITPGNGPSGYNASVTFSFSNADLNGETCSSLLVYHYDGGGVWSPLVEGASHTYTRQCTTEPYSIQVTGVTTFSPFVLADTTDTPTAVILNDLTATSTTSSLPMVLSIFGLLAGGLLLRRRTLRTTPN